MHAMNRHGKAAENIAIIIAYLAATPSPNILDVCESLGDVFAATVELERRRAYLERERASNMAAIGAALQHLSIFAEREHQQRTRAVKAEAALAEALQKLAEAERPVVRFCFSPDVELDALRFRFITHDHQQPELRAACRQLLARLNMMSTAAARADIDALMTEFSPPKAEAQATEGAQA